MAKQADEAPAGVAHINHMPIVKIDGDQGTVVNHSHVLVHRGDRFRMPRVSASRWDLVRVDGHWRVERKLNRLLNGSRESKDVLVDGTQYVYGDRL